MLLNLLQANEGLGGYLDLRRNVVQEYLAAARHGTMVAGIIAQQEDEIGLLPYRFYPPEAGKDGSDPIVFSLQLILQATERALDDGARIINYSTFFCCRQTDAAIDFEKIGKIFAALQQIVRTNRDVLFIASAGFCHCSSEEQEEKAIIHFPAGLHAANFLVVGALTDQNGIAPFSNVPRNTERVIFTIGENICSTNPRHMIDIPEDFARTAPSLLDDLRGGNETFRSIGGYLLTFADRTQTLTTGTGTSFAAPLLAHLAAKIRIAQPEYSASEAIDRMLAKTEDFTAQNGKKIKRLFLPKPFWR